MQGQVYTGARATCSINGELVGAAFVTDYSIETKVTEIETIDSSFPAEIAPDRIRVAMNLRVYRTPDNDPVLTGIAPGGAAIGETEQINFLTSDYILIEIKDRLDQTILHIPKAMITRRSASINMGDLMTENWSIVGIGYLGPTS